MNIDRILNVLEALPGVSQVKEGDLIFLDKIQEIPQAITALRYFYEDQRDIPVIAAGSLFDLVLSNLNLSMPVGRVEYLHMVPMTFTEFLDALGERRLLQVVREYELPEQVNEFVHQRLSALVREYSIVGGMPEAVKTFADTRRFSEARRVHTSIVESFRDDFSKYLGSKKANRVANALNTAARNVGQKVKYVHYSRETPSRDTKSDLEALATHASDFESCTQSLRRDSATSRGRSKGVQALFLDVGLMNTICGLDWRDFHQDASTRHVNQGIAAEQFVGQHMVAEQADSINRELNYWLRERRTNNAEVDFVIAIGNHVVPIEVKSGASGSLKSLHQFAAEKQAKWAVRFDTDPPYTQRIQTTVRVGQEAVPVDYTLVSLPLYLVESLPRIFCAQIGV